VTSLITYLFSSGAAVLLSLAAALWVVAKPSSRLARRTLVTVTLTYAAASTYVLGHSVDRLLVAGFEPFSPRDAPGGATAIVVLGSGTSTSVDWDENTLTMLDIPSAMRVLEAARVFRLTNARWVVSSGGLVNPDDQDEPSGSAMRDALARLGVPAEQIVVEVESRNTREEAMIVAPILSRLGIQQTILVTSDVHMRRSLGAFRAVGVDAIPAIARHWRNRPSTLLRFVPTEVGLHESALAAHEVLGLAYYLMRGWYRGAQ
jgi:uncharacterized SAM-binding protein YcdF (DUF218 family)